MSAPYSAVVQGQRDPQAREFESLFSGPSAGSGPDSSTITAQRHEAGNPTLSLNATELTNCFNDYTQNNDKFSCILPEEESAYQDSLYLDGEWEYLKGCDTSSAREESAMDPALDKSDSQGLTREQNLHRNRGDSGYHSLSSYNELEINHRESMSLNSPVPGLQDTSTSDDRGALLDGAGLKSQAIDPGRGRYRVDPVPRERKSLERDPVQLDSHEPDMRCSSNGANTPWDPVGCWRDLLDNIKTTMFCPNAFISGRVKKYSPNASRWFESRLQAANSIPKDSSKSFRQTFEKSRDIHQHSLKTEDNHNQRMIALDVLCPRLNVFGPTNFDHIGEAKEMVLYIIWTLLEIESTRKIIKIKELKDFADLINMATLFEIEYDNVSRDILWALHVHLY
jgi:hypothetical protein